MGEGVLIFLLVMGVIAITAVLFGGWLIVTLLRMAGRGVAAFMGSRDQQTGARTMSGVPPVRAPLATIQCGQMNCRAGNPGDARFCRRCGRQIVQNSRYRMGPTAVL